MNPFYQSKPTQAMKSHLLPTPLHRWLTLVLLALVIHSQRSLASATYYLPYQGYLTDQNGNPLGSTNTGPKNYNMVFRIWDLQTGGAAGGPDDLYCEEQTVTVNNGYFSVLLGAGFAYNGEPHTNSLAGLFNPATTAGRWVETSVQGINSAATWSTILPRLSLQWAPYAFQAVNAQNAQNIVNAAGASQLTVNGSYVGIGTASPGAPLDVLGQLQVNANGTIESIGPKNSFNGMIESYYQGANDRFGLGQLNGGITALYTSSLNSGSSIQFGLMTGATSFSPLMTINHNGTVGVGTTSPATTLEVSGSATIDGGLLMKNAQVMSAQNSSGTYEVFLWPRWNDNVTYMNFGSGGFNIRNNSSSSVMFMQPNGRVGIGTVSPAAGLDVEVNVGINGTWSYFSAGGSSLSAVPFTGAINNNEYGGTPAIAIYTSGNMGSSIYYAFSDARIKNVVGISSGANDLNTLRHIEVTDFTYKDVVAKGAGPVKKVIAQQVEKVYPQAVTRGVGVVPDIYHLAPVKNGWVQLATDLKVGERVRLIAKAQTSVYDVLAVTNGSFRVDLPVNTEQIFVYGREVNDFRSVDYDAISMLNVSATQELAKRLDQVEAREARLAALERKAAQVDDLEREVADLKKLVAQLAAPGKNSRLVSASDSSGTVALAPVTGDGSLR